LSFIFLLFPVDPSNPSNVYACLRTIDAFGIQNVGIITQPDQYRGKAAIYQKRNMRTAMGSAKWLTITNYVSTEDAIRTVKEQHNCRIYASDLNPNAIDIRTIEWSNQHKMCVDPNIKMNDNFSNSNDVNVDQPICIVMGNEESGISDTMRNLVDVSFTLPMVGFAESFNLSVATAIILAHLSAVSLQKQNDLDPSNISTINRNNNIDDDTSMVLRQPQYVGPIRPDDLPEHEYNCLYLKALIHSLPQKRMARGMLQKIGIILPKELHL
jgi:tRNA(Leu) C34 or U34 (ribose-2'-O)-methylase TrmL